MKLEIIQGDSMTVAGFWRQRIFCNDKLLGVRSDTPMDEVLING